MKKILLLILMLFLSISPTMAQKNKRGSKRDSIKALTEAIDSIKHRQALDALKNKAFVIKFDRSVYNYNGIINNCDPLTNFIILNENNAVLQTCDTDRDTFFCKASDFRVKTTNKGETVFEMKLSNSSADKAIITLTEYANYCNVRVHYMSAIFSGQLYPLGDANVLFLGRSWTKWSNIISN